jgi:hypothetical protein
MSIAQLRVAGEGEIHPSEIESVDSVSAAEQIFCCTRNLPHLTLRAHQRALSMITLPLRARCALAAVALTVDCRHPLKEVFAHRDYLAERAGLSERTWYRAEADLVLAGLITVAEQGRKARHGRFGAAYIYLTEVAAKMLGLVGAPVLKSKRKAAGCEGNEHQAGPHDGHEPSSPACDAQDQAPAEPRFAPPSANVADPYTSDFYQSPSSQKRQPGTLPLDLERLLTLGFHKNLVFKLMKEARLAGKFLSDVVECCWEPLKSARTPIAYLRALLARSVDFSHQTRQRQIENQNRHAKNRELDELASIVRSNAGKSFVDHAEGIVVVFSTAGDAAEVIYANESRPRYAAGSALLDLARGIRNGQLQPDTNALKSVAAVRSGSSGQGAVGKHHMSVSLTHARLMRDLLKRGAFVSA